jgi:phosphatidylserine/phosphatidylglycerophosphate/cardiolipin synthase-like enzyme
VKRTLRTPVESRRAELRLLFHADHYEELIARELSEAKVSVWIATANLKELRVDAPIGTRARARGELISILETFESLVNRGVEVRVLHGRTPSGPFSRELASRPELKKRLALRECPRVHLKMVALDGRLLYLGSANFTGAGLGARSEGRRNFELGILSEDEYLLDRTQAEFDRIWRGRECGSCKLRRECPKPIDSLLTAAAPQVTGRAARPRKRVRRQR